MHKSPSVRACVRGASPARRPSLPRRGQGGAEEPWGAGRSFPSVGPPSRAGLWGSPEGRAGECAERRPRGPAQSVAGFYDGGENPSRYSMTRQRGRCCEKYLKSSGVAPGQLVSSSSSSSCSCTRPDSPVVVSSGQPAGGVAAAEWSWSDGSRRGDGPGGRGQPAGARAYPASPSSELT